MERDGLGPVMKFCRVLALAVALGVCAVSLYTLFIGVPGVRVPEGGGQGEVRYSFAPQSAFGVVAGILLAFGLWKRRLVFSWVGLVILFAYASLFMFGTGGIFFPVALVLLILLAIVQVGGSRGVTGRVTE